MAEKKSLGKELTKGIIIENPVLRLVLGTCPTLATTTTVTGALGMGLAATAVLILSNVIISLLRKIIPNQVRIASYIVIISGAVTAIELLMKAYLVDLYDSLGIFIPLIVVNCIILARAEAFASKNTVFSSFIEANNSRFEYSYLGDIYVTLQNKICKFGGKFLNLEEEEFHKYLEIFQLNIRTPYHYYFLSLTPLYNN